MCRNTGAASLRSSAASSGSASRLAYASSTRRPVVNIPRQSIRSFSAARKLNASVAMKSASQGQSMRDALLPLRGELQDGLVALHPAEVFAHALFDVRGIVLELLDRALELLALQAQLRDVTFERVEVALHLSHLQRPVPADDECSPEDHRHRGEDQAPAHRAGRVYSARPGHDAA